MNTLFWDRHGFDVLFTEENNDECDTARKNPWNFLKGTDASVYHREIQ
ncbi:MAG: hypothetical protein WC295_11550 [Methanoregula sp.]|nr:hypothetical protein [Methanoregula sp.]